MLRPNDPRGRGPNTPPFHHPHQILHSDETNRSSDIFAILPNPIVVCLTVAGAWVIVDPYLGPRYGALVITAVGAVALNSLLIIGMGPFRILDGAHWPMPGRSA